MDRKNEVFEEDMSDNEFLQESAETVSDFENIPLSNKDRKNSRTPSGNLLTDKVSEGKQFFQPSSTKFCKRKRERDSQQGVVPKEAKLDNLHTQPTVVNRLRDRARKLSQHRSASLDRFINKSSECSQLKQHLSASDIQTCELESLTFDVCGIKSVCLTSNSLSKTPPLKKTATINKMKESSESNAANTDINEEHNQSMDTLSDAEETNYQQNPQMMSVSVVQEMFASIRGELKTLSEKVEKLEASGGRQGAKETIEKCTNEVIQQVNDRLKIDEPHHDQIKKDLKYYKRRTHTLTEVVQRMHTEVEDLKSRLENVEISTSRRAVSISGLYIEGQKAEIIAKLEAFFYKRLGVSAFLEEAYVMGKKEPKVIIAYFQSTYDKRAVMENKHKLKTLKNKAGGKVYINDYTTVAQQERKQRDKRIYEQNKKRENPLEIKYYKGAMTIQGEVYRPKVEVPTPTELINIEPKDLDSILKMKLENHGKITQDKSTFEGYTAAVSTYQQIRRLYIKMKLIQPSARHIVCAYYLPGEESHYTQGFCDDGEPGAGRNLLRILTENNMSNRVVFVARHYGGIRMSSDRFECYTQAATTVIKSFPRNDILKADQQISQLPAKPKEQRFQSKPKGRGQVPLRGGVSNTQSGSRRNMSWKTSEEEDGCYYDQASRNQGSSFRDSNDWSYERENDWLDEKDGQFYQNKVNDLGVE